MRTASSILSQAQGPCFRTKFPLRWQRSWNAKALFSPIWCLRAAGRSRVRSERGKYSAARRCRCAFVRYCRPRRKLLTPLGSAIRFWASAHECDFPAEAATKPSLLRPRVDPQAAPAEIDRQVSEIIARGESIYAVDAELLALAFARSDSSRRICATFARRRRTIWPRLSHDFQSCRGCYRSRRARSAKFGTMCGAWAKRRAVARKLKRLQSRLRKKWPLIAATAARAESRPRVRVPGMARSLLRGRALDSGNGFEGWW